ncbi:branched-chain amino acid transport system II carrier protein [Peptostreptococcus canis]|uniref:Branched-chain amino acid transport system carrier protein n=1 Tax=Peptostreptococcus canis TaxID=1159213 RepID=A0ABR6TJ76_9FIRM|nr:branched-chain amino acid transport system II carrier protein [Peptostreptococcus canis]MBC2575477.1 branched-chain amino acid transport system II carrier protein [Peptostreptococcus canis]MBP1997331.1 LIVCS family branched-chain amino acid:cation transporter [Peptostreptococcus canis]
MEIKRKDVIVCGFALFAIFFGAGNLIFPPHLGVIAGDRWYVAMFAFLLSDPVLPILGVIVTARLGGRADDLGKRVSPAFAKLIGTIAILTIGPFFAVPRTGATTHEIFVKPLFPSVPIWATAIVFFGLTLYITLNPGKVIDVIGKYLTPALLVILTLIVVISIVNPPDPKVTTEATGLFTMGFSEGYQTMDALGSPLMAGIVMTDLIRRGYSDKETQFKASVQVGIVAFVLLALVYGGLTYAGATVGGHFDGETERTALLIGMVELMLGNVGKVFMGVAVALACLTTSTGLSSTCGNYFETISGGKLKYKYIVMACVAVAFVLSLIGVDGLIAIAVPILSAIYPVIIVLIVMSIFDHKIKYNWTYTGAVIGAFVVALIESINLASVMRGGNLLADQVAVVKSLPLAAFGFEWILPAVVCSIILTVISMATKKGKTINDPIDR